MRIVTKSATAISVARIRAKMLFKLAFAVTCLLFFYSNAFAQVAHTVKQLEHSKLYAGYGIKGHDLTKSQNDDGVTAEGEVVLHATLPSRLVLFRKIGCETDAVVLGRVTLQVPLLTPDKTFIFTDSDVSVLEVIKNNPALPISTGESITVTRPGGTLQLGNRKLSAKITQFDEFRTGGEYLFFLKFLPSTQDYRAVGDRTFELRNGVTFGLTPNKQWDPHQPLAQDSDATLADARIASHGPCNLGRVTPALTSQNGNSEITVKSPLFYYAPCSYASARILFNTFGPPFQI